MANNLRETYTTTASRFAAMTGDDLKELVRDGMLGMNIMEREEFIGSLADELRRDNFRMSVYLVPLGIPGRSPEDLTPTEVGHFVRFLKMILPQSIRAVERALTRYPAFTENVSGGDRLAA